MTSIQKAPGGSRHVDKQPATSTPAGRKEQKTGTRGGALGMARPDVRHHRPGSQKNNVRPQHAAALATYQAALRETGQQSTFKNEDGQALVDALDDAMHRGSADDVKTLMDELKARRLGPRLTAEIVAARHAHGTPSLFFALKDGRTEVVAAFMEGLKDLPLSPQQIAEIVAAKMPDGTPSLFFAMRDGHADTVAAFMKGLGLLGLSGHQIADIAAAKNFTGTPGLQAALTHGHAATVTAFVDGLQGLGLDASPLAEIAAARKVGGRNGLYHAYRKGHEDAAKAFVGALNRLQQHSPITTEQIDHILAAAKLPDEVGPQPQAALLATSRHVLREEPREEPQRRLPAVSYSSRAFLAFCGIALFAGVVRQLLDGGPQVEPVIDGPTPVTLHLPLHINDVDIDELTPPDTTWLPSEVSVFAGQRDASPQQVADIMAGKGFDGGPGLLTMLMNGQPAGITAFMERLKGLGLNPQQMADIVAAKDPSGEPGLFFALYKGHAAAVTAFMEGLKALRLNPQQVVDIVGAKGADGVAGLYFALQDGHADAVTAFMDGLKGLGLSPEQIAEVCMPRNPEGFTGLFIALDSGRAATVTAFVDGLGGLGLSPEQITEVVVAKGPVGVGDGPQDWWDFDAAAAYVDSLARLEQQKLITAEQVKGLLAAEA